MFNFNKKSTFLALAALLLAALGVVIGLAAYFKNREHYLYEEDDEFLFDDPDDLDYYSATAEDSPGNEDALDGGEENIKF